MLLVLLPSIHLVLRLFRLTEKVTHKLLSGCSNPPNKQTDEDRKRMEKTGMYLLRIR